MRITIEGTETEMLQFIRRYMFTPADRAMLQQVVQSLATQQQEISTMALDLTALTATVKEVTTAEDSAVVALNAIHAQNVELQIKLDAAIAAGDPAAIAAAQLAIDTANATLKDHTAALAAAIGTTPAPGTTGAGAP